MLAHLKIFRPPGGKWIKCNKTEVWAGSTTDHWRGEFISLRKNPVYVFNGTQRRIHLLKTNFQEKVIKMIFLMLSLLLSNIIIDVVTKCHTIRTPPILLFAIPRMSLQLPCRTQAQDLKLKARGATAGMRCIQLRLRMCYSVLTMPCCAPRSSQVATAKHHLQHIFRLHF